MTTFFELKITADANHPSLAGHFPGSPIVPGVVLLDWVIQALDQHLKWDKANEDPNQGIWQVDAAKFLNPVFPGDDLQLSVSKPGQENYVFELTKNGVIVTTGKLRYVTSQ